ncbi:MAG: hypothetical protein OXC93_09020, partial [Rhodospirillaceae bacterium]|nr:hypothetical protein [Rhodospirillaceae bacterium]
KREFGSWIFKAFAVLAQFRFLRGTIFDPFGKTAERKAERSLIVEYEETVQELIADLSPETHDLAVQIAEIPDSIRGYGHVKEANTIIAADRQSALLRLFRDPIARRQSAVQEAAE